MKNPNSSQSSEDDMLHYVKGSIRQRGYWRRRPWTNTLPTKNQRRARALFGRIAHDQGRNKFGKTTIIDNAGVPKEVPSSAVPLMDKMVRVAPPTPVRVPVVSTLERLKRVSELLARISEST